VNSAANPETPEAAVPEILPTIEVRDLDWPAIRKAADADAIRRRMPAIVQQMEALLDAPNGPGMLFDRDRKDASDRVIHVSATESTAPLWVIGDLHGDLLALEAALAHIRQQAVDGAPYRIIFLGDFIDDEGFSLELLLRVYELVIQQPERICVIAGNHDEALRYDGARFSSTVSPGDFADVLNQNLQEDWMVRTGKLVLRVTAHAARALFLPDGLLVTHGGFPLVDLHAQLVESGNWNAVECLADFVWTRMHPKARRKLPNRFARGSQFGYEDFAEFCRLSQRLGRNITHMVRGHDHPEDRYAIHPAYQATPVLTTVALSRRLPREVFGPYERAPTVAHVVPGALPQVHQLHIPASLVNEVFPQPAKTEDAPQAGSDTGELR